MNPDFMRLAIELAEQGRGFVNPNPCVGAVIVKENRIIGKGWHQIYGEPHAERNALMNLTENAADSQMYVTLEPCCHHGKQPPCVEAIVEHGIQKVYIGSNDPNPQVAGKGIAYLQEHNITVVDKVLKDECDALNPVFFHYITKKTPFVAMKYAMTMDGKIAASTGASKWITTEESRTHAHMLRHIYSSIMVGISTVLQDDPMLDCRIDGYTTPIRIICDSNLRIPMESKLIQTAIDIPTYVAYAKPRDNDTLCFKIDNLTKHGVHLLEAENCNGKIHLPNLMDILGELQIDSILLEGGGTLNESFVKQQLVNRVYSYVAPKIFGGTASYTPVGGEGVAHPNDGFLFKLSDTKALGDDILLMYERR